jgi:imidazolonepropionase-like amidohydrolase
MIMYQIRYRAAGLLAVALAFNAASAMCAEADFVIDNVKVFSPPQLVLAHATVAVDDGRIVYVGSKPYDGKAVERIDGQGRTLIPGLIDSHVHLFIGARSEAEYQKTIQTQARDKFRGFLSQGVTTLMSVGDYYPEILAVRDAVNSGQIPGPRLLITGPMIAPTAGHPTDILECVDNPYCRSHWAMEVDDVATARQKVRELAKNKVDMIKIAYDSRINGNPTRDGRPGLKMGHFKPEVVRALIDEAHAQGLRAGVYPTPVENGIAAMEWGADVLTHGPIVIHMRPDGGVIDWPDERLEKFASMAAQKRMPMSTTVATLSVNPDLWGTQRLLHTGDDVSTWPQDLQQRVKSLYQQSLMDMRLLMERGVPVAYASDSYRLPSADSVRYEFATLREAGLSAEQIVTMATRNSALLIGREQELGSIEVGKIADLVLLAGDPQQNIAALGRVDRVWKDGKVAFDYYQ